MAIRKVSRKDMDMQKFLLCDSRGFYPVKKKNKRVVIFEKVVIIIVKEFIVFVVDEKMSRYEIFSGVSLGCL